MKTQNLELPAWQPNVDYSVGDRVLFGTRVFRSLQAHTSQTGWEPSQVPALWVDEGEHQEPPAPSPEDEGGLGDEPPRWPVDFETLTLRLDCNADPAACCVPNSTFVELTEADDTYMSTQPAVCLSSRAGSDTIFFQSAGPSSLILGSGNDVAQDTNPEGSGLVWGGYGDDTISSSSGVKLLFGSWGSDTIQTSGGSSTVVPGPGVDTVQLAGDDNTVHIFDLCEVESGETLAGGSGTDTLYTPVPLAELELLGVVVSGFENVIVQAQRCRSECVARPSCDHGVCFDDGESLSCACDPGWQGERCDQPLLIGHPEGAVGVPQSVYDSAPPNVTAGVRELSARRIPGPGLLVDDGVQLGGDEILVPGYVPQSTGGSGTSGTTAATSGIFEVRITRHTEGGDGTGFGAETYLEAWVDGRYFPRDDSLDDCTGEGDCPTLRKEVSSSQATVSVHLKVKEADGGFEGDDDEELDVFLTVNNFTGKWTGHWFSDEENDGGTLGENDDCATSSDGFGLCWSVRVVGRPKYCPAFKAAYLDAGYGEPVLGATGTQSAPAAFALAAMDVRQGSELRGHWDGVLDAEGCVPEGERMRVTNFEPQAVTGQPLTVVTRLYTQLCYDQAAGRCAGSRGFAEFIVQDGAGTSGPSELCTVQTEDPNFVAPAGCDIIVGDGFPGWVGGVPGPDASVTTTGHTDTTRAAGVMAAILGRDAATGDMGIREAFIERSNPRFYIKVNDACLIDNGPQGVTASSCVDPADGHAIKLQAPVPGAESDTYFKYVIAHEFGHVIHLRTQGFPDGSFNLNTTDLPLCSCDHVDAATNGNNLHCLQGAEYAGAAIREGFAQFYAAKALNLDSATSCQFQYYKPILAQTCWPSAAGCDVDPGSGLFRNLPPIGLSCAEAAKRRNRFCGRIETNLQKTLGTEWDWMTFLYAANQDTLKTPMRELLNAFESACSASAGCSVTFDGTSAGDNHTPQSLVGHVRGQFDPLSPVPDRFVSLGDTHGVSTDNTR